MTEMLHFHSASADTNKGGSFDTLHDFTSFDTLDDLYL